MEETMFDFWLVKMGKLYYVGGLKRFPYNENSFSLEFAKDKEVAFLFSDIFVANHIAEKCGGVIEKKEITSEEYIRLLEKHKRYIKSEIEWEEEERENWEAH